MSDTDAPVKEIDGIELPTYFPQRQLLGSSVLRSAYSDRRAYELAEMSNLAYFPFEGGYKYEALMDALNNKYKDTKEIKEIVTLVKKYMKHQWSNPVSAKNAFRQILLNSGYKLVDTFSSNEGCQGFVATDGDGNAFLVFRGTKGWDDIKSDVSVKLMKVDYERKGSKKSVLIHEGFYLQYKSVENDVKRLLAEVSGRRLFITGHSLGGALAMVATKFQCSDELGATYTFGQPRVGTKEFHDDVKTPVYRVINQSDPVASVPNPILGLLFGMIVRLLFRFVSWIGKDLHDKLISQSLGILAYRHCGYSVYIIKEPLGRSVMRRGRGLWGHYDGIKAAILGGFSFRHHSIVTYTQKLASWAESRL